MNSYIWIHIFMNSYMNSESIHLNSYTWIHILMNSYIHFIYEFRCIWIHIIISYMNSHMIIWIHTYMNSYIWLHIWIHIHYEFIWFFHIWIHMFHVFINEFGCTKVPDGAGLNVQNLLFSCLDCKYQSQLGVGMLFTCILSVHDILSVSPFRTSGLFSHARSWQSTGVPVAFQTDRNQNNDQTVSGHEPNH